MTRRRGPAPARAARAALVALVSGAALGAMIACVRPDPGPPAPQPALERKHEITALWTQIREWRREAGLAVEPAPRLLFETRPMSARKVRALCPRHQPRAACADVCDLADAICDNAESICAIAEELGRDAWAEEKCASAKASCREAKERCCACGERDDE